MKVEISEEEVKKYAMEYIKRKVSKEIKEDVETVIDEISLSIDVNTPKFTKIVDRLNRITDWIKEQDNHFYEGDKI